MNPCDRAPSAQRVAATYKQKKKIETKDGEESTVYVYSDRQLALRAREKAERVEHLRKNIGELRSQVHRDLGAKDDRKRLTALAVSLIEKTCERVGNPDSAESGHYGVTGWLRKHLSFKGGKATLKYVGKSGVRHEKVVDHGPTVSLLRELAEGKSPEDPLLSLGEVSITSTDVNEYLEPFEVTAKDIRGYRANTEMCRALKEQRSRGPELPRDRKERDKILKEEFDRALEEVAEIVGHEPATLKGEYLTPGVAEHYLADGTVIRELDERKASADRVATRYAALRPGESVRVPGYGQLWAEETDSDNAFPPAVAAYRRVGEWLVYEGRDGSRGVVVGTPDALARWQREVDEQVREYPPGRDLAEPYDPQVHGGAGNARAALQVAQRTLRRLGVSASVVLRVTAAGDPRGEYGGGVLTLVNVHHPGVVQYSGGVSVPVGEQIAAHEAAHVAYARGGREVMEALRAHRLGGGPALTLYHALEGDFEGAMEAASLYVLAPRALFAYSEAVYSAVAEWFGEPGDGRTATKTHAEREDEAVAEMVRPAPKKKPPRRDLRKRRIVLEDKPEPDPDLSLNYKKVASRVAARFLRSEDGSGDESFREWYESRDGQFLNKETGNRVDFGSLPEEQRTSIYENWKKNKDPSSKAQEPAPAESSGSPQNKAEQALSDLARGGEAVSKETSRRLEKVLETAREGFDEASLKQFSDKVYGGLTEAVGRAAGADSFGGRVRELLRGPGKGSRTDASFDPEASEEKIAELSEAVRAASDKYKESYEARKGKHQKSREKLLAKKSELSKIKDESLRSQKSEEYDLELEELDSYFEEAAQSLKEPLDEARSALTEAAADHYRQSVVRDYLTNPETRAGAEPWEVYDELPASLRRVRLQKARDSLREAREKLSDKTLSEADRAEWSRKAEELGKEVAAGRIHSLVKGGEKSEEEGDELSAKLIRETYGRVGPADTHLQALARGPQDEGYRAAVHNLLQTVPDSKLKDILGEKYAGFLSALNDPPEGEDGISKEDRNVVRIALINSSLADAGAAGAEADEDFKPLVSRPGAKVRDWWERLRQWVASRSRKQRAPANGGPYRSPGSVTDIMRTARGRSLPYPRA